MTTEVCTLATHQGGMQVLLEADGHQVPSDYPLSGGGPTLGMTSLQLLLGALASCSANGLQALLRREGILLDALKVKAVGIRKDTHPTVLESIHLEFQISGTGLDPNQIEQTLTLAESRICPVWVMLRTSTPITRILAVTQPAYR